MISSLQRIARAHGDAILAEGHEHLSVGERLRDAPRQTLPGGKRRTRVREVGHDSELRFWTAGDDLELDVIPWLQQVARADRDAILAEGNEHLPVEEHLDRASGQTLPGGKLQTCLPKVGDDSELWFWTTGDNVELDVIPRPQRLARAHGGSILAECNQDVSVREHPQNARRNAFSRTQFCTRQRRRADEEGKPSDCRHVAMMSPLIPRHNSPCTLMIGITSSKYESAKGGQLMPGGWMGAAAAPSASTAHDRFDGPVLGCCLRRFRREQRLPVRHRFGRISVNLEPGQRFAEDIAMGQRAFGPRVCREIAKTALQREQLAQPLDVAARQRQLTKLRTFRAPPAASFRMGRKNLPRIVRSALDQPERHDQTAEQDRIRQGVRRRLEPLAIRVDLGKRSPERLGGAAMKLVGDRLEQSQPRQVPERPFGGASPQDLVVLLQQARRASCVRSRGDGPEWLPGSVDRS